MWTPSSLICSSLLMTTPSMHNSKIGGFISLLTHNAWNLEALDFIKLYLNHCITTSDANSRSFLITLMSLSMDARLLSST